MIHHRATRDEPGTDGPAEAPAPETTPAAVGFGLVERLLGAAAPSLYGVNSATFAAVLSAEGVGLVEKALLGGGLPAGVVYTLRVTALRPALRAQITARWQDAYHFYETACRRKLLLAAEIGPPWNAWGTTRWYASRSMSWFRGRPASSISGLWTRSSASAGGAVRTHPGPGPPPEAGEEAPWRPSVPPSRTWPGSSRSPTASGPLTRSELKTFTYQWRGPAERLTFSPQGTLAVLVARRPCPWTG